MLAIGSAYFAWRRMSPARKVPIVAQASPSPSSSSGHAGHDGFPVEKKGAKKKILDESDTDSKSFPVSSMTCEPVESAGFGPHSVVSAQDWALTIRVYHQSKDRLKTWIASKNFSADVKQKLEKITSDLKIQRAPSNEEPDLSWRGISVLSRDSQGAWILRTGGGFAQNLHAQPSRGQFELTRLLVQAWPLEGAPWSDLLSCLHITDPWEARWALSTIVAAQATPTGCQIPGLQDAATQDCIAKIGWGGAQ